MRKKEKSKVMKMKKEFLKMKEKRTKRKMGKVKVKISNSQKTLYLQETVVRVLVTENQFLELEELKSSPARELED